MFFEVAGITVPIWIPPLVAFIISFFTSMAGISGAFILLPFQMSVLGFTGPAVSATNQVYNIISIPSGVLRYIHEGRMVWSLTWLVVIGTLPGVFIGAFLRVKYLPDPTSFKIFAGFVLLYICIRIFNDLFKKKHTDQDDPEKIFHQLIRNFNPVLSPSAEKEFPKVFVKKFNLKQMTYEFYGESYSVPTIKIFIISCFVGIVAGAYGIGGGAIMAPIFIALFGLPVYTVAGATLMATFVTSIASVAFYYFLDYTYPGVNARPDWLLGLLFGAGGVCGMYLGARSQKFIPARVIKWILGISILFLSLKYISEIFKLI
ncbi:MAG: sulfite exporter TauE/SafE family protein [Bacteroidota bacterium]